MRSKQASLPDVQPDLKYGSVMIARLINRVMRDGKKSIAERLVYDALELVAKETGHKPGAVLDEALQMIVPQMEVRSRRIGGAAYQVPMPIRGRRGESLAVRWLVTEAQKRPNKQYHTFAEKLAAEMIDAINNVGGAIAKRDGAHRMAEANKAFAHFRW